MHVEGQSFASRHFIPSANDLHVNKIWKETKQNSSLTQIIVTNIKYFYYKKEIDSLFPEQFGKMGSVFKHHLDCLVLFVQY